MDAAFIAQSRYYLQDDFLPKIERAVALIDEETIWWRPNPASNSIGNLMLHLAGNVRQWIVSGIAGAANTRQRQLEFDTQGPMPAVELLTRLRHAVAEACGVLSRLEPDTLSESRQIQGNDVSVMEAIYHVVEHFSMHTGQILYIVKLRTGEPFGFYKATENGQANVRWNAE
ncbi:MAG: DinB family protein [Rhodothermales bacterium]